MADAASKRRSGGGRALRLKPRRARTAAVRVRPLRPPRPLRPLKRGRGLAEARAGGGPKRQRTLEDEYRAAVCGVRLVRPKVPAGQAWPVSDLRAFDAPTEGQAEINYGPMLRDVLKARGWKYSTNPCHGVYDPVKEKSTFYVKEFEASVQGRSPQKVFGRKVDADGYRLQEVPLPNHALWMMGRMPYRVPGTAKECAIQRDDFCDIVVKHGDKLQGKAGNYRIAKFPGTETILFKTNFTAAFKDKPWYPTTYVLPREKAAFLAAVEAGGETRANMWIGKPRNEYGGSGICVWKGLDNTLVREAEQAKQMSVMQRYLADPLLIGGYKFHMRIHLLITQVDPLEAYVQENGQCLFATKPYTTSCQTLGAHFDPPVHVTNMGLNATDENKDNFLREKPVIGRGQQLRMKQLAAHLAETQPNTYRHRFIWQQILMIAKDTSEYIAQGMRRHSKIARDRHFEMFGMDLMLDKNLKVWMCEVNTDPGLGYPDKEVLGSPNPDYKKESRCCEETLHDMFSLLGLDSGKTQAQGSLSHWFKIDFGSS